MNLHDIKNIESEAGIIATILNKPEYTFHSEQLKPNHFSDEQNAYIYYAISELAKKGIDNIDAYNITNVLNAKESTKKQTEKITISDLNELIDLSKLVARDSLEEYNMLTKNVLDKALRRTTLKKLHECERLCFNDNEKDLQQKIYETLDKTVIEFSLIDETPQFSKVVRKTWKKIRTEQESSLYTIPFQFPTLNKYVKLRKKELILFSGSFKMGKSMMLMGIAADFIKRGIPFLYIDSELDLEQFVARLISHFCKIEFNKIIDGNYSNEEEDVIERCVDWLEERGEIFTHLKVPVLDFETVYTATKKARHTHGLEALICDYIKPKRTGDAHTTYNELGYLVDGIKNQICSAMDIIGVGAVQATSTGKVADSTNVERSASAVILIDKKTPEEIAHDGRECGNRKLIVKANRLGEQFDDDEYIDMEFNGNIISFQEAKQHEVVSPY